MVTIYRNIFAKEPNYITVDQALERIKTGRSKEQIFSIREMLDKERADNLIVSVQRHPVGLYQTCNKLKPV